MKTKSNTFSGKNEFEQQFLKLLLELLFLLEKARMRGGLSGSPGKGQYKFLFTWAGTFFYLYFCILFFTQNQDSNENGHRNGPQSGLFWELFPEKMKKWEVRFDCTGAYGLHVSPRPGAPKATQNYSKKQVDSMNLLFRGKIGKWTKSDPPRGAVWASKCRFFLSHYRLGNKVKTLENKWTFGQGPAAEGWSAWSFRIWESENWSNTPSSPWRGCGES